MLTSFSAAISFIFMVLDKTLDKLRHIFLDTGVSLWSFLLVGMMILFFINLFVRRKGA